MGHKKGETYKKENRNDRRKEYERGQMQTKLSRTKAEKMMSKIRRDERRQSKDSENMRKNESKTVATVDISDHTHLRVFLDFSDTL